MMRDWCREREDEGKELRSRENESEGEAGEETAG